MKKLFVVVVLVITLFLSGFSLHGKKQREIAGKAGSVWVPGHGRVSYCDCPDDANTCTCLIKE